MKNEYKRKTNFKIVALIIEVVILLASAIIVVVFEKINKPINVIPFAIVSILSLIALIATLSRIRYEYLRAARSDFYNTNLPLYTDKTTMICHDLIDEKERN